MNSTTNHLSKLSVFNPCSDIHWLGRNCRLVLFFPALCLGALGIFRAWHHGADRHCIACCIFPPSPFSIRASRRIECHCAPGFMGGRVWRHPRVASTGTPRYPLCNSRSCRRSDRHRIFHPPSRKSKSNSPRNR